MAIVACWGRFFAGRALVAVGRAYFEPMLELNVRGNAWYRSPSECACDAPAIAGGGT